MSQQTDGYNTIIDLTLACESDILQKPERIPDHRIVTDRQKTFRFLVSQIQHPATLATGQNDRLKLLRFHISAA